MKIDGRRRVSLAIAIVAFVGPALGVSAEQPQGSLASPASANRIETQVFDNYALSGPTSRRLSNVDALSCFASCRADGQCAALTYVKWSRECLLKRASGEFRFEPNSLSAVTASAAPPTAMTGPIEMECNAGVSFMAKETDSLTDISIENCEKVCERDASCVGFVHASSQRLCKLFKTIDWISPQAGVVGGVKRQEATDGSVQNISCEELTAVEKENYNQARGDREKLLGYIRTCRICADAEQAKAGIAWFDAKKAEADAEASKLAYLGLYALQHRGQESAGIAVSDGIRIVVYKDMGLVPQVFDEAVLHTLRGHVAVGHCRYSTSGSSVWENAQPTFRATPSAGLALGHNGNLINTLELA